MLDEVLVSRQGDSAKLELRFACRNRYVDHRPSTRSDRIRISLARVDECELSANATPRRDVRRPTGRELAYLRGGGRNSCMTLTAACCYSTSIDRSV